MRKTGRVIYVPKIVLIESNNIRLAENIISNAKALEKMAQYSILGRERTRRQKQ